MVQMVYRHTVNSYRWSNYYGYPCQDPFSYILILSFLFSVCTIHSFTPVKRIYDMYTILGNVAFQKLVFPHYDISQLA